jgi:hypothetical protein
MKKIVRQRLAPCPKRPGQPADRAQSARPRHGLPLSAKAEPKQIRCLFCCSMNMTSRAEKCCSNKRDKHKEPEAIQQESSYLKTRESAQTLASAGVLSGDSLTCVVLTGSHGLDSARVQKSVGG